MQVRYEGIPDNQLDLLVEETSIYNPREFRRPRLGGLSQAKVDGVLQ